MWNSVQRTWAIHSVVLESICGLCVTVIGVSAWTVFAKGVLGRIFLDSIVLPAMCSKQW